MRRNRNHVSLYVGDERRFELTHRIGRGAFGLVYKARDTRAQAGDPTHVAVKLEDKAAPHPQLAYEYRIYRQLTRKGWPWLPRIYWYGVEGDFNCLVMELLGQSLESHLAKQGGALSPEEVCALAPKMIQRIQYLHESGLLHRDIKPDNFLFSTDGNTLFLIDFGLAKIWRDPSTREHIAWTDGKSLTGTARYASIHTHKGEEQSRRDDLEALGYVLVYLCRGSLPWQGVGEDLKPKERNRLIGRAKRRTKLAELCDGLPKAFRKFLKYCRALDFEEEPDYEFLRDLFGKKRD